MSVYQTISETGFVIGHFDPHNVEAEVKDGMITDGLSISKATTSEKVADALFEEVKGLKAKLAEKKAAPYQVKPRTQQIPPNADGTPSAGSRQAAKLRDWEAKRQADAIKAKLKGEIPITRTQQAADALAAVGEHLPKSKTGKVAVAAVPVAAVAALNHKRIKAKTDSARDVRRYRPASLHYDDGFGKAAEEIIKDWVARVPEHRQFPIVPKASAPAAGATPPRITATRNPNTIRDAANAKVDAEAAEKAAKKAEKAIKGRITREANTRVNASEAKIRSDAAWETYADNIGRKNPNPAQKFGAKAREGAVGGAKHVGREALSLASRGENPKFLTAAAIAGAGSAAGGAKTLLGRRGAKKRAAAAKIAEAEAASAKAVKTIRNLKVGGAVGGAVGTTMLANSLVNRHRRPSYAFEDASKSMDDIEKGPVSGAKKLFASATPKGRRLKAHIKSRGASGLAEDAATGTEKLASTIADISGHATRTSRNVKSVIQDVNDVKAGNYNTATAAANAKKSRFTTTQKVVGGSALAGGLLIGHNLAGPKPYPYQQQQG